MFTDIGTTNLDAVGSVEAPMALLHVGGLGSTGTAVLIAPPPVVLPAPEFESWEEAVDYARAAFVRLRYLASQVPVQTEAIGAAQITLAETQEELRLLQIAATALLAQGQQLA